MKKFTIKITDAEGSVVEEREIEGITVSVLVLSKWRRESGRNFAQGFTVNELLDKTETTKRLMDDLLEHEMSFGAAATANYSS